MCRRCSCGSSTSPAPQWKQWCAAGRLRPGRRLRDDGPLHAWAAPQQFEHLDRHARLAGDALPTGQFLLISDKRLTAAVHAIEAHAHELIASLGEKSQLWLEFGCAAGLLTVLVWLAQFDPRRSVCPGCFPTWVAALVAMEAAVGAFQRTLWLLPMRHRSPRLAYGRALAGQPSAGLADLASPAGRCC